MHKIVSINLLYSKSNIRSLKKEIEYFRTIFMISPKCAPSSCIQALEFFPPRVYYVHVAWGKILMDDISSLYRGHGRTLIVVERRRTYSDAARKNLGCSQML